VTVIGCTAMRGRDVLTGVISFLLQT
jgi:hypothetical protein